MACSWVCAGGLLQLYSVTGDTRWLHWCQSLQATLDELFWDDAAGASLLGFCAFQTIKGPFSALYAVRISWQ